MTTQSHKQDAKPLVVKWGIRREYQSRRIKHVEYLGYINGYRVLDLDARARGSIVTTWEFSVVVTGMRDETITHRIALESKSSLAAQREVEAMIADGRIDIDFERAERFLNL